MRPLLQNLNLRNPSTLFRTSEDDMGVSHEERESKLPRSMVNAFERIKTFTSRSNLKQKFTSTTISSISEGGIQSDAKLTKIQEIDYNSSSTHTIHEFQEENIPSKSENDAQSPSLGVTDLGCPSGLPNTAENLDNTDEDLSSDDSPPATLARRIQSLILSSIQQIYSSTNTDGNTNRPPVEPGLASLLSSIPIMNGSLSQARESVWSVLDRLRFIPSSSVSPPSDISPPSDSSYAYGVELSTPNTIGGNSPFEDASSVMLYSPLIPDDQSEVEVARSEIVSFDDNVTIETRATIGDEDLQSLNDADFMPFLDRIDTGVNPIESCRPGKTKEKFVWVPSVTKISLQTTWWGYRIYLPPPVIAVLNSQSVEAANRAAIITTALKWLLDHIPASAIPPQFRMALVVLQQLVPIVGYVGSFIGWSWKAVKGFDRGYGVILSATWILPIAPIPGTWEESDFLRAAENDKGNILLSRN